LGITFSWSRPPSILIPGTALYWPVSATITSVVNPNSLAFTWTAARCPYAQVSNLATASVCAPQWTPENFLSLGMADGLYGYSPVGTVITHNNALAQAPPAPNSIGYITGRGDGDSNGLMSIITDMGSYYTGDHIWSYVYQWVPEAMGTCGGTCTLASPGQNLGATGGTGSVGVTATSSWTVIAPDSWIHVTSSVSGTGNTTVTFTADPNTGGPRSGTLIIGGQQYTVFQAGSATSTGSASASTSIAITNPGFETIPANPGWISCSGTGAVGSGGAGCQDTLNGIVPGWTASSTSTIGLFQPGPNLFTLPLPAAEETTVLQINSGTLSQTLSATLQPSTLYTLQVDVGRRLDNLYPSTPPTAQLFAGSTLIASATGSQPPLGGWTTWTGTYQSAASDPLAGQALKIVLGTTASQGDFDNVRLTAVEGPSTAIANPGFETFPSNPFWLTCPGTGCRYTNDGNVPGWTASSGGTMGILQPGANYFTLPLPTAEGQTVAWINTGTLSQTLGATLQPSTSYTLQVDVGRRLDGNYPSSPPTAQLFAGSTLIASAMGSEPPLGGWTTWTGTYQSSASDPLAGQTLKIVLGATAPQGDFDNVRLTATSAGTSTGTSAQFTYSGFASTAGLTLVGNAATTSTSDGKVLRLTPATGNQSGAAYSTTPVTLGNNAAFSTQFQFRFTNPGGWNPADGITFVLGTSTTGLGAGGVGMGYQGVGGKSVGIEFDTYNNAALGIGDNDGNSSNHVSIDTNGVLTNTDLTNVYNNGSCGFANGTPPQNPHTVAGCMSNGDLWTANIVYDGSNLTVTLTDPAEPASFTAINSYPINLASALGQNTAYVGLTSGTGAGWENHDIVNWTFSNTPQLPCTYLVNGLTQNQPSSLTSGNITGSIQVNAGAGCAWTAVSDNSWITITNGTPGSGSGVVTYQVSPNTATATRSGTVAIAGQTVTVNQAAAAKCAYSISPTSSTMQAIGGASSVLLSANPSSCPWSVAVGSGASSWLHVTSPTSGTGALSINFTVDQNATTLSRSGTIALADQTLTVTQAGGASTFEPNITPGGIVNAANNRGGSIAQGSLITIYGSNLGPATPVQALAYPIPATLGNVTVSVTQGSTTLQAYLKYVSATQINAILPSNTPLGNDQLTVSYLGAPSAPATINIVATAFGIFSVAGGRGPAVMQSYVSATSYPLNTVSVTAKPSQILIIWATGLGPITTGDNTPPPGGNMSVPVQVLVGGQQAPLLYSGRAPYFAGVDNVYVTVPANAPLGCYVPVQVNAAGAWSNTVTISLTADGSHCKDTGNPLSNMSSTGGKLGILGLVRLNYYGQLDPTKPPSNSIIDLGIGDFAQVTAGGDLAFSPFMNLPPAGSCKATNRSLDLGSAMGTGGSSLDPSLSKMLDAGASLAVTGPKGSGTISQISSASPYVGALGGSLAAGSSVSVDSSQMEPFLDTGPFTIKGTGGADVGAFSVTVNESPAITWTNETQIAAIDRSQPLTLTWTGGDQTATMLVIGASSDPNTLLSGGFSCLVPVSAGTFTVPPNVLADLVPVNPTAPVSGDASSQLGVLGLMPLPMTNPQKFTATGLDTAYVFQSTMLLESVQVK
jgi:uncharacterized protein (TIGR03437 family)